MLKEQAIHGSNAIKGNSVLPLIVRHKSSATDVRNSLSRGSSILPFFLVSFNRRKSGEKKEIGSKKEEFRSKYKELSVK